MPNTEPYKPDLQPETDEAATQEWNALLANRAKVKQAWLDDGLLTTSKDLAQAWDAPDSEMADYIGKEYVLALSLHDQTYHPSVFKALPRDIVIAVCRTLHSHDKEGMFIFWTRHHPALGGLTIAEAISQDKLEEVLRITAAWAEERRGAWS